MDCLYREAKKQQRCYKKHDINALQEFSGSAFSTRKEVPYGKGESQNSQAFNE